MTTFETHPLQELPPLQERFSPQAIEQVIKKVRAFFKEIPPIEQQKYPDSTYGNNMAHNFIHLDRANGEKIQVKLNVPATDSKSFLGLEVIHITPGKDANGQILPEEQREKRVRIFSDVGMLPKVFLGVPLPHTRTLRQEPPRVQIATDQKEIANDQDLLALVDEILQAAADIAHKRGQTNGR